MKYSLDVKDTNAFFEKIRGDKMFACEESLSGLTLRYNGVFTLIANPKINLNKISDSQFEIDIRPGVLLTVISVAFTLFFWAIGTIAIVYGRLNVPLIILAFLLPLLIWILRSVFNRVVGRQIFEEIGKHNREI